MSNKVDVVLLELQMPKPSGVEALTEIRAQPNPPAVIVRAAFLDVLSTLPSALGRRRRGARKDQVPADAHGRVAGVVEAQTGAFVLGG